MAESPFELAFRDQCATRPTERGDFYAGWSAALRWRFMIAAALMDEFRVTAVVSHDGDCTHTEVCEPRTLSEAVRLAGAWPLSSGYRLVSAVVEVRAVTEWTEYKKEQD